MDFYSLLLTLCVCIVDNLNFLAKASPNVTMENFPTYEGQCDHPFTAVNGGRCYFPSYDLVKNTWKEAQLICSWLHPKGQLAEFETLQEMGDATSFLIYDKSNQSWGSVGPWIGATEKDDSNTFIWHSSKSPVDKTNWAQSRPYCTTSGDGVALNASDDFQWIDLSSGTELPFLCEIPSNPRPDEAEYKREDVERRWREVQEVLRKKGDYYCFPGLASLPQEGAMTVTKRELQNLEQPGASPQPPSLTIGAWTMDLFMRKESSLFLVVTYSGRVDQAYALTFRVRVNAGKWISPFSRTYTSEYFDRRRRRSAVYLLYKDIVSNILAYYFYKEALRLEVQLLEAVATDVKGNMDKNEITIKARFANVTAMELWDEVYSEPHFLGGFRVRLKAKQVVDLLFLYLSCIGNVLEGNYSVSLTSTATLERDDGKGGLTTKSINTYDQRNTEWEIVEWWELMAAGSGWIREDGTVRVTARVKINE
ncbi:unnamed protein product [Cyprideis torosa]|uniref:Uncharacterized protein n=1 Tax=Cyprideis torosa TaxID=163714 RepID=A0A7R8W9H3_9CRUS|nr:unnamed protein product [Cyprideis torosa]CAG0889763.1 unnamed protein product [Cyprideis torosa]